MSRTAAEINCATGEVTYRELSAEEIAMAEADAVRATEQMAANEAAQAKYLEDKAAGNQKLKDLGLTDDEIAALTS